MWTLQFLEKLKLCLTHDEFAGTLCSAIVVVAVAAVAVVDVAAVVVDAAALNLRGSAPHLPGLVCERLTDYMQAHSLQLY